MTIIQRYTRSMSPGDELITFSQHLTVYLTNLILIFVSHYDRSLALKQCEMFVYIGLTEPLYSSSGQ